MGTSSEAVTIPILPGSPPELVVYDKPGPCPYLDGRVARLPLRLPTRELSREELDDRLLAGDRRQGYVLYRTACPACRACEPIRIDVTRFSPDRSQRRAFVRGQQLFDVEIGVPVVDSRRVALYNLHKRERGLGDGQPPIDRGRLSRFPGQQLLRQLRDPLLRIDGELVAIALSDHGQNALSAVYCYYDPAFERASPGTFSIMKQVELCRNWGLRFLYLGLYIADCDAMQYKARYMPHERLINGSWRRFER